jgi:hypothetical protein
MCEEVVVWAIRNSVKKDFYGFGKQNMRPCHCPCQGNLVDRTREKVNLSSKHVKEIFICSSVPTVRDFSM